MIRMLHTARRESSDVTKAHWIAAALRDAITAGQVREGELLPSTREIACAHDAHRHTVLRAMTMLAAEGWVDVEPRRGFRVAVAVAETTRARPPASRRSWFRAARDIGLDALPDATVQLGSGGPDLRLFPIGELRAAYAFALRTHGAHAMGPAPIEGHARLVKAFSSYLRRVRGVTGRPGAITGGAHDAFASISQLIVAPGDRIAVESPGYPPAWEAFRLAGATLVGLAVDREGVSVTALARALRQGPIRALYTTPHHQYPTTVTLSIARRAALLRTTARAQITVIEDDYDHEYHYTSAPIPPLASHPGADHVVYVTTLTKALFPS